MAERTAIAWTDHTFNPWLGCRKVSEGCRNCYAERLVRDRMRVEAWGSAARRKTGRDTWRQPARWNARAFAEGRSRRVFSGSLCDVFEDRPELAPWRAELFATIRATPGLDWQLLTKRPGNLARMLPGDWGQGWPNVWLGTSVEDARWLGRVGVLARVPAAVRFVSYEPALGSIAEWLEQEKGLDGIDWLIYGGESGPGFRRESKQWARDARDVCGRAGVAFFHKQSAGHRTELGIELDGEVLRAFPRSRRPLAEERQAELGF